MSDKCEYCNKDYDLSDFADQLYSSITILEDNKEKDIYLCYNKCRDTYLSQHNLVQCAKCYKYGTELFHKECMLEYNCYECNKFVDPSQQNHIIILDKSHQETSKVFHKDCIDTNKLCPLCKKAYRRECLYCYNVNKKLTFAYGCYNNCKYGEGSLVDCYYCN